MVRADRPAADILSMRGLTVRLSTVPRGTSPITGRIHLSSGVTDRTVFPRRCQLIFLADSRIPMPLGPADSVDGAGEWDRILTCVGTSGIPTPEEPKIGIGNARQRRPGGLRVLGPRPPLRGFTKEMGLAVLARRTA